MGRIVAIGGGEILMKETYNIDKYIVGLSGVKNPKILFIPTASIDALGYIKTFEDIYGEKLGCRVDKLLLCNESLSEVEIERKILSSDIIYVGGGDTANMMRLWKKNKVDKYLIKAYESNIILSGISAGGICWFYRGHGDCDLDANNEGWWDYTKVEGLNLINAIICPHYNHQGHEVFDEFMRSEKINGIALEDNCAIVIDNSRYKIICSNEKSRAYLLKNYNGKVSKIELDHGELSSLLNILN